MCVCVGCVLCVSVHTRQGKKRKRAANTSARVTTHTHTKPARVSRHTHTHTRNRRFLYAHLIQVPSARAARSLVSIDGWSWLTESTMQATRKKPAADGTTMGSMAASR